MIQPKLSGFFSVSVILVRLSIFSVTQLKLRGLKNFILNQAQIMYQNLNTCLTMVGYLALKPQNSLIPRNI